jgi:hypothetical protein
LSQAKDSLPFVMHYVGSVLIFVSIFLAFLILAAVLKGSIL